MVRRHGNYASVHGGNGSLRFRGKTEKRLSHITRTRNTHMKKITLITLTFILPLIALAADSGISSLTINVKDTGAVGDGVVDDTAALQKALTGGGRTVVIPDGTYLIRAALLLDSRTTLRQRRKGRHSPGGRSGDGCQGFSPDQSRP